METGFYRARVEDNKDPMRLGRIRFRIPSKHGISEEQSSDYLDSNQLPWAFPVTNSGTGYQHGSIMIPHVGDYVFITYEDGKVDSPIYLGGCYGIPKNSKEYEGAFASVGGLSELPNEVYLGGSEPVGRVIYRGINGVSIVVNESENSNSIVISDDRNKQIKIDRDLGISIQGAEGQSIQVGSLVDSSEVVVLSRDTTNKLVVRDDFISLESNDNIVKVSDTQLEMKHSSGSEVIIDSSIRIKGDIILEGGITASSSITAPNIH